MLSIRTLGMLTLILLWLAIPGLAQEKEKPCLGKDSNPSPCMIKKPCPVEEKVDEEEIDEEKDKSDPTKKEVPLPALAGWNASLVIDNDEVGIWTVKSFQIFQQYASPEIVGLDDQGRCLVLVSYSGKWTPQDVIHEKKWLGGLAQGDVDPRIEGKELYTGGLKGNLYQVLSYPHGELDYRFIGRFPGHEIHTILAGDLDPRVSGSELLIFTRPGALYRVTATGAHGTFEQEKLQDLSGRVRDAVVLPASGDSPAGIATVSRAGQLSLFRITEQGPEWEVIYQAEMGMGRIALGTGSRRILYSSHDDGRILRHEQMPDSWKTETIYLGPQGPRGIAAGRFSEEPEAETVAVFGYSGKVQLLTRGKNQWTVETLFEDRDKGHWLATAELDGRNGTREIIGSGYGSRIFMLSRPPGYGKAKIVTEP